MPVSGWPSPPARSAHVPPLMGGYRLGAERTDELADKVVEVIVGIRRAAAGASDR